VAAPIGLHLARTARAVSQAFERAMAEAGGSASMWQVLILVRSRDWSAQSEIAEAMGVTTATLTHHLNALEAQGLVRRWRESGDRRVQRVELTDEGVAMFDRLRAAAARHDKRLRAQLSAADQAQLAELLDRLRAAVDEPPTPPRRGARADRSASAR
jgi:MarR family transcriptional regulator, transcriptional regulator for hemolysin